MSNIHIRITFALTTRLLLQVLDSAGEFGWQLERAGLSGDGVGVAIWGDSGSPFGAFDLGGQIGKAPGLREPPTSAGTLQKKERKCCNELNLTAEKCTYTQQQHVGKVKTLCQNQLIQPFWFHI